jgi:propanol-preferring alcohol dehydrogenase
MQQAVRSLAVRGRAALAGITQQSFHVSPYHELINKEAEIIGVSDHLASELPLLIKLVKDRKLDLSRIVSQKIGLDADSINKVLDALERFDHDGRAVITLA